MKYGKRRNGKCMYCGKEHILNQKDLCKTCENNLIEQRRNNAYKSLSDKEQLDLSLKFALEYLDQLGDK